MSGDSRNIPVMRNLSRTRAAEAPEAEQWISTEAERPGPRLPVLGLTLYFSGDVVLIL